jgi:3-oxosteroid 1-dehydrogenase
MLSWDNEFDVVVIGTGAAGLTAALTASSLGARVGLLERASTVGGTTAISGGVLWVPAHDRQPEALLPVEDALTYMRHLSSATADEKLFESFVRTAPQMLDFIETHSPLRFVPIPDYLDDQPDLPGGKHGGRSFIPAPYEATDLGTWASRIMAFPADLSGIGFDVESGARSGGRGGFRLVTGLLESLLLRGVPLETGARAVRLITDDGAVVGVWVAGSSAEYAVRALRGVVLASGGFEWDEKLVGAFLRGPMHGAASPAVGFGDGLRMAMAVGADLANMSEAWWDPIVQIPGETTEGRPRYRGFIFERTRPRSVIVNQAGRRFVNEAAAFNSIAGPFHFLAAGGTYVNDKAWVVFDAAHLERYGAFGTKPGEPAPEWFCPSADVASLAEACGIDQAGLITTIDGWNRGVSDWKDPEYGRGRTAHSGWSGDHTQESVAQRTLGPINTPPYCAVPVAIGALGTKGGPRTDVDGRVCHVLGGTIRGLFAAGNVMAAVTGNAYGGPGVPISLAMTWGYRAGHVAATGAAP